MNAYHCLLLALAASCGSCVVTPASYRIVAVTGPASRGKSATRMEKAFIQLKCPQAAAVQAPPAQTNAQGEFIWDAGHGVSSDCTFEVAANGFETRSYAVSDTCLEPTAAGPSRPYQCRRGQIMAELIRTGRWNADDANRVASELFVACLADPAWLTTPAEGRVRIQVGQFFNRTDEHIDLRYVANILTAAMVDSSRWTVVSGDETAVPPPGGYLLALTMRSILNSENEGRARKTYQTTIEIRGPGQQVQCAASSEVDKVILREKTVW